MTFFQENEKSSPEPKSILKRNNSNDLAAGGNPKKQRDGDPTNSNRNRNIAHTRRDPERSKSELRAQSNSDSKQPYSKRDPANRRRIPVIFFFLVGEILHSKSMLIILHVAEKK